MSSREANLDCEQSVDAAPYVLGALQEPEPYREHLASCAACQAEVAELQPVVDMLPMAVPPAIAPEGLRRRLLATVRPEADLLRAAGRGVDQPPKPKGRRGAPRGSAPAAWVAIALGLVVAGAIAFNVGSGSSTRERVTPAQIAPSIRGARASLRQSGGHAELVVSGMPQPQSGKVYEVWLGRGPGSVQPTDALFSVTSQGNGSVNVPGSLHGVKEVMVTSEPFGGSARPTSTPVIRVALA
jgi:hypothetical protein